MAMTLAILYKEKHLILIAGFENGMCSVFALKENTHEWITTYRGQAHSQPVLSLDVNPSGEYFISSSADALIAKHPIPTKQQTTIPGHQAAQNSNASAPPKATGGIGALFSGSGETASKKASGIGQLGSKAWEDPIKVVNTKHAGQQNLSIRSDGRIFATAGWDSKIRIYATKSLKELAVLKWHQVGVYAVAFACIEAAADAEPAQKSSTGKVLQLEGDSETQSATANSLVRPAGDLTERQSMSVKDKRMHQARHTHWVAAGAKDGKLSLWDIY